LLIFTKMRIVELKTKYDALIWFGRQIDDLMYLHRKDLILDNEDPMGLTLGAQKKAINYETAMSALKRFGAEVDDKYPKGLPVHNPERMVEMIEDWYGYTDKNKSNVSSN